MEDEKKILSTEETEENIKEESKLDSLDALLLDDDAETNEESDSGIDFEAFMADYRSLMSKNLSEAAEAKKKENSEQAPKNDDDGQSEFLISKPKKNDSSPKKKSKRKTESSSDWDEEITLEPEEYAELVDESEPLLDEIVEEEATNFDLGDKEVEKRDDFQISINFDGEEQAESDEDENDEEPVRKYDPENPRAIDWVFDIVEIFAFVLAVVILLTSFVFRHSIVDGDSMNNTLQHGDSLIISDLFYTPERFDIIVFEDYSTTNPYLKKPIIKRVIGLPGETVEVKVKEDGRGLIILIDGKELEEDFGYYGYYSQSVGCGPITLGEDEVFVMGDNRNNSTDSRSPSLGAISTDTILGKVLFRFAPFDKFGKVE